MIGLSSVHARDAIEAIQNGYADDDLDAIDFAVRNRRDALVYPTSPECGEVLKDQHIHGSIKVTRLIPDAALIAACSSTERTENG